MGKHSDQLAPVLSGLLRKWSQPHRIGTEFVEIIPPDDAGLDSGRITEKELNAERSKSEACNNKSCFPKQIDNQTTKAKKRRKGDLCLQQIRNILICSSLSEQ